MGVTGRAAVRQPEGRLRVRGAFRDPLWLHRHTVVSALARVAHLAGGLLLDVGCGNKPTAHLFEGRVRRHLGLEYPFTAAATHRAEVFGDAARLPIRTASVDTVLCVAVLYHDRRPGSMLGEMARVLRPGGVCLVVAPLMRGVSKEATDFFRFTPQGLRALAAEAGLAVLDVRPCGGLWAMVGQRISSAVYEWWCARPGRASGAARMLCGLVQAAAVALDTAWPLPQETLNLLLVARRDSGHGAGFSAACATTGAGADPATATRA